VAVGFLLEALVSSVLWCSESPTLVLHRTSRALSPHPSRQVGQARQHRGCAVASSAMA
jgi:hypothetical protein